VSPCADSAAQLMKPISLNSRRHARRIPDGSKRAERGCNTGILGSPGGLIGARFVILKERSD
jgi:hypothetical protein